MADQEYQAALQGALARIEDPARWGPLLALSRRVGRLEEAARALAEALPADRTRAPLELALLRAFAEADVSLGRHWWACPTVFTNVSTSTPDGHFAYDLLTEGVQVLSGPGFLGRDLLPWPEGVTKGASTQLFRGEAGGWVWLLATPRRGAPDSDLLAFDPAALTWTVAERVPGGTLLEAVDPVTHEVVLRPAGGREGPSTRHRYAPLASSGAPLPQPPPPAWAQGLAGELGTAPLGARELAFGPDGETLAVTRGWRTPWLLGRRDGVARTFTPATHAPARVPLGAEARWRAWEARPEREGAAGLAVAPRHGEAPARVLPLPAGIRPSRACLDPGGDWLLALGGDRVLTATALAGPDRGWTRTLDAEPAWVMAGAGAVALLGLPEEGVTLLDLATGEPRWRGPLPAAARPGHAGGLGRAGLLARARDGAWLLRSRDSLVWLEPEGAATLVEAPEPETLPSPAAMAVAAQGDLLVLWGEDGALVARDPRTGARRHPDLRRPPLTGEPPRPGGPLGIDPAGRTLVYLEGDVLRLVRLDEELAGAPAEKEKTPRPR